VVLPASALIELLRIRLVPTAWADVLAGAFLAGTPAPGSLAGALVVSSGLYLFGMATNAVADRRRDAHLYPRRPLPSGRITVRQAWAAAGLLLLAAAAGAALLEPRGRLAASALFAAIVAYNAGGKRVPLLGPLLMGSCRSLNLLVGAWGAGQGTDSPWSPAAAAGVLGLFVACVTQLSAWEGAEVPAARLRALVTSLLVFPLGLLVLARPLAIPPLVCLALLVIRACPHGPFRAGHADERPVHQLLPGIYLLDAFFLGQAGRIVLCGTFTAAGMVPQLLADTLQRRRNAAPD
jgi:4-hydroxybenzoate polyprenyltransferase